MFSCHEKAFNHFSLVKIEMFLGMVLVWSNFAFTIIHGEMCNYLVLTHACMLSLFSWVQLFGTPWPVSLQVPLSKGFSREEYWGGLLCPPPGDLPHSGNEAVSLYISCVGSPVLYHQHHLGSLMINTCLLKCFLQAMFIEMLSITALGVMCIIVIYFTLKITLPAF